jgi:hypothetical protein
VIRTQSAKAKGRRLQNYVRDLITKLFDLEEGDVESCSMGASGVDIKMSPRARRALPISIECKKTKATPSRAELEQATCNAYGTTIPAVVWCPHGKGHDKSMIMFDLNEFLAWYKEITSGS